LVIGHQVALALRDALEAGTLEPLHHHAHRAIAQLQHAHDGAEGADVVQLVGQGRHYRALGGLEAAGGLHDGEQQTLIALDDLVDELDGPGVGEGQRQHDVGIDDELAQRQDGKALHYVTFTECAPETRDACLASRTSRKPCS